MERARGHWSVLLPALLMAGLGLAGCGFEPMYAAREDRLPVTTDLGAISVAPITMATDYDGERRYRLGQMLEDELERNFYRGGVQAVRYRLDLDLERSTDGFGFRPDEAVTRIGLRLEARYRLVDTQEDTVILEDSAQVYNSFDVVQSDFATLAAEQDMEARLVRDLGQRITLRLGRFFGEPTQPKSTQPESAE